jgi:hypothetical protein
LAFSWMVVQSHDQEVTMDICFIVGEIAWSLENKEMSIEFVRDFLEISMTTHLYKVRLYWRFYCNIVADDLQYDHDFNTERMEIV